MYDFVASTNIYGGVIRVIIQFCYPWMLFFSLLFPLFHKSMRYNLYAKISIKEQSRLSNTNRMSQIFAELCEHVKDVLIHYKTEED